MFRHRTTAIITAVFVILTLIGVRTAPAAAQPAPINDDIGGAILIPGLDFSDTRDTSGASESPDDPDRCFGGPNVWYTFTPAEAVVFRLTTAGSSYFPGIDLYGGSPGALSQLDCGDSLTFVANAGETFYILVSGFNPGTLVFSAVSLGAPFDIDVSIDGGSYDKVTGAARISGTVTCSAPAFFDVLFNVEQRVGRTVVRGDGQASGSCDGVTPWTAETLFSQGAFKGGRAGVSASASGCDQTACDSAQAEATVRLSSHGK